jgi:hypothetical protein
MILKILTQFKCEIESNLDKFRDMYRKQMIDMNFYCFDIKMQKDVLKRCEAFTERIKPLMSEYLFKTKDARNMIRMCPHCGEIWSKTEGCDCQTTCGTQKLTHWYDFVDKPFKWFKFSRDNKGKLLWNKSERPKIAKVDMPKTKGQEKRRGCGGRITWSDMCLVDEKVILELFEVATIDQANERINQLIQRENGSWSRRYYDVNFYE